MFKLGLEKAEEPQRSNCQLIQIICWIIEKAREFQKNIYLCFIDYTKASDSCSGAQAVGMQASVVAGRRLSSGGAQV